MIVGRECSLLLDRSSILRPDLRSKSPWSQPLILVDKRQEFPPHKHAPFPPPLSYAVGVVANESLFPEISTLKNRTEQDNQDRKQADLTIWIVLPFLILLSIACAVTYSKKEEVLAFFQEQRLGRADPADIALDDHPQPVQRGPLENVRSLFLAESGQT